MSSLNKIFWCKKCVVISTRPRITFNAAGIDLSILDKVRGSINKPILVMGGAGKPEHLSSALTSKKISGVITANLFNFLGDGLKLARDFALNNNISLAKF